jgi:hypothetical protein
MFKQCFANVALAGVSLTDFGLKIPSPFTSLSLSNSEISSMTQWTLECIVGGDDTNRINVAAFEALLYQSAQNASNYSNSSGIPCSFIFGWLNPDGSIAESLSYQGYTLTFKVSTSGRYMKYSITGYASLAIQTSLPVLRIPEVSGVVQPSAIVEGLAIAVKATNYYDLDIDHNDSPTLVTHGALTTSFNRYVRGSYNGKDDYVNFPGLLKLSKSYNSSRDSAGLNTYKVNKLSQAINNRSVSKLDDFLKTSFTDTKPQSSTFSYWVDEPTMTQRGCIHYKSNAGLVGTHLKDTLEYGTANTNVLTLSGSYNGVAYNMTDMNYTQVGFIVDGSGNTVLQDEQVINSWSSTLADVFQSANIVNDVNAIASQFSGDFTVTVAGSTNKYEIAQPISLLVMSGNTISPITGIYNIISVSHDIGATFITTLKLQRLVMSTANQVAAGQNILIRGSSSYPTLSYATTKNIVSTGKVEFGDLYPDFTHLSTYAM